MPAVPSRRGARTRGRPGDCALSSWVEVFGRLHPLLLHLPIGGLVALALIEAAAGLRRRRAALETTRILAWFSAASAVVAAGTGYVLNLGGGYASDGVTVHLWLGLATAASAVATAVLRALKEKHGAYLAALGVTVVVMIPAGHYGAVLTHGAGFLLAPLQAPSRADVNVNPPPRGEGADPWSAAPAVAVASDAATFDRDIAPVFLSRCAACHGETKTKGDLALHTREAILAGGESGPLYVVGKPEESELLRRLGLPEDDREHMPPEGKPQLLVHEKALIAAWVAAGAPFDAEFKRPVSPVAAEPAAEAGTAKTPEPAAERVQRVTAETEPESEAPAQALAELKENLIHVAPVSAETALLWVDFAAAAPSIDDAGITRLLEPLRDHVADLSLARSAASDAVAPLLGSMSRLQRLDLRGTRLTDAGAAELSRLDRLEELNLAQTAVTDASVDALMKMRSLKRVHLWRSGVNAESVARMQAARPELTIITDEGGAAEALETEGEIKLTGDLPPPGAPAASETLTPVNSVCPVSGAPVNARYLVVHEGRVIGFCCPNCPKEFWSDPSKFPVKSP